MSNKHLGTKLKLLRKEHHHNQEYLGKHLNISRQAYSLYEIGKRNPSFETLAKIAKIYDVTFDYLLSDYLISNEITKDELDTLVLEDPNYNVVEHSTHNKTTYRYENISPMEKELLQLFSMVSTEEQRKILAYLKNNIEM